MLPDEKRPWALPPASASRGSQGARFRTGVHKLAATCAMAFLLSALYFLLLGPAEPLRRAPDFSHLAAHCAHVQPIPAASFVARQDALASTLHALGGSAYIAEPGANAGFYANLSGAHWHLSERPLLLIITPNVDGSRVSANVSILTPSFEATRAKLLSIPSSSNITYPEWPEDANPYEVAVSAIPSLQDGTVYVDDKMRQFIVEGLQKATSGSKVLGAPVEIVRLRERKSKEEIEILKCVNEATVLGIRAARSEMYIGIRESEARALVTQALLAAGLTDVGPLTLFGSNAALPHGGGTDRQLSKSDFILVDCGGSLHGYYSDVTRTFALDDSVISNWHLDIWNIVYSAQSMAIAAAHNGTVTADVDRAARETIKLEGYGEYFTHRLGHGIGLENHESPYLRGGSEDIILTGHVFSDEPGIYIEGEVGVRHEDCFYIDDDGSAVFLTDGVGGQPRSPWDL